MEIQIIRLQKDLGSHCFVKKGELKLSLKMH
jgi:hypothetical protein